ncbi:universal stress protein [Gramella sp. BOM4]|nr:universal stress protein [Christiangramia bathymodioli]
MKNILIATDFSKESYCALYYTAELFREGDTRFLIANFYGEAIHKSIYSLVNEEEFVRETKISHSAQENCTKVMHQVIRDTGLPKERFEVMYSEEKLESGIKELVKQHKIDLLVMATSKHEGSLSQLQDTHTTKIINKGLPCPILIVPREMDYKVPKKIAFASDLKRPIPETSIKLFVALAEHFKSQVHVVYDGEEEGLSKKQWANFTNLKKLFPEDSVKLVTTFTHIEISRTIAEYVKNNKIDLLGMIYYKHSIAGNIFREPVVENIDRHLSFPFLILPEILE